MATQESANQLLPLGQGPRVVVYAQTHHAPDDGPPISLLPLLTRNTGVTHIILAAFHLNDEPGHITLNDHIPSHERFNTLWSEIVWLRPSGIKVLGMIGGAAPGTFKRLDTSDPAQFEAFYVPLRDVFRQYQLDGVDLDIEEPMSLTGCIRLIDRLRSDFGPEFLITLAPVATGLLINQPHLSGPEFNYHILEAMRGQQIAWYNVQFYNGWGDASTTMWYETILATGWKPEKILLGVLTSRANGGSGYVEPGRLAGTLAALRRRHPTFGGVMGWEYFNAEPGGLDRPWEWVETMAKILRSKTLPTIESETIGEGAQSARSGTGLSEPQHPFPADSVRSLQDLGFTSQQAIAALNNTNGNVEYAAGLLFAGND